MNQLKTFLLHQLYRHPRVLQTTGQATGGQDHDQHDHHAEHTAPAPRAKSRLNRVGKEARIKAKKSRGTVKAARGKVEW